MEEMNSYNPAAIMAMQDLERAQQETNLNLQRAIQDASAELVATTQNLAEKVARNIYNEVIKYQAALAINNDVAMMITSFGGVSTLLVDNIGYIGDNLIVFHGMDSSGKPVELIQHIHQLNFLLQAQIVQQPLPQKRTIGFGVR